MEKLKMLTFKTSNTKLFALAKMIRNEVFIVEQKVREEEEFDKFESECIHYLLSVDDQPVGTARWRHIDDFIKLERFAVLKDFRNKRFGDQLLEKVINDALKAKKSLYLHAQLKAIPFYERRGFRKEGELFWECNIAHYKMILD